MRIEKITINNFRSFWWSSQSAIFPDINKPISIIGYNNAGKSNLIRSLLIWCWREYKSSVESLSDDDFFEKNIFNQIELKTDIKWWRNIETLTLQSYSEEMKIDIVWTVQWPKIHWETLFNFRKKYSLNNVFYFDFHQIDRANKMKTDWNYTILWRKIKEFKDVFESDIARKWVFKQALESLVDTHIKDQAFDDFVSLIKVKINDLLRLENQSIDINFWVIDHNKVFNMLSFYLTEEVDKPLIPLENMGNGYRALFIIAILRAIAEDESWNKIFILEEPETFLHEHYQEYFYEVLKKIAVNNQVILTTHSKKFVDVFNPQTIIRLDKEDWETKIRQNTENLSIFDFSLTYPDEYWKRITTLEPNIGNILFSKKVIIVEWTHDVLAYKMALDIDVLIKNWLAFNNISVVASHWKSSSLILIKLCKHLQIPYFVIHDRDLETTQPIEFSDTFDNYTENILYTLLTSSSLKWQYTNNFKIYKEVGNESLIHWNKPKIEESLWYKRQENTSGSDMIKYKDKSSETMFHKLNWKTLDTIRSEYPLFISDQLLNFINPEYLNPIETEDAENTWEFNNEDISPEDIYTWDTDDRKYDEAELPF